MTLENIQLSGNAKLSAQPCADCGKYFVYYPQYLRSGQAPKRCPRCKDLQQGRPSVAEERRQIALYEDVKVVNLPGEWTEFHSETHRDTPQWRIDIKGQKFGAAWEGRIVIYAPRPIGVGETVTIREMEVLHRVKVKTEIRQTLHHGPVAVERELSITGAEGEEALRSRRYLVLESTPGVEPRAELVWATAHTKTTLKGFGRQYWAKVGGTPIAQWKITGGYRSGRAHTEGVLAIVSEDHPLLVTTTGDIQEEVIYK
ncbi:MAG: hypothetical protein A2940_01200 [Candidatus Wildermuthbacteria bacterium RIFCSPLOWO2_01_FULL_48_29]|uniref:Uncharacterized protein n=1 Tax=Candidatus Wildermuthbacteria bacterium RIFCSPLOWO2_01_FULL_48_29 TaxID=1802462 RepID=A0A1G2RKE9_9BACT|nr:MAG: hypothetical protein A2940_01200 [Candidatus Wildermuthbacteria bacterium RIFCSPLOWO2_01_FULL_48_29]